MELPAVICASYVYPVIDASCHFYLIVVAPTSHGQTQALPSTSAKTLRGHSSQRPCGILVRRSCPVATFITTLVVLKASSAHNGVLPLLASVLMQLPRGLLMRISPACLAQGLYLL